MCLSHSFVFLLEGKLGKWLEKKWSLLWLKKISAVFKVGDGGSRNLLREMITWCSVKYTEVRAGSWRPVHIEFTFTFTGFYTVTFKNYS